MVTSKEDLRVDRSTVHATASASLLLISISTDMEWWFSVLQKKNFKYEISKSLINKKLVRLPVKYCIRQK